MSNKMGNQNRKTVVSDAPVDMPSLRVAATKADNVQGLAAIIQQMIKLQEGAQPSPMFVRLNQLVLKDACLSEAGDTLTMELLAYYGGTGPRIPRVELGLPGVTYFKSTLLPIPQDAPKNTAHCLSYRLSLDVAPYAGLAEAARAVTETRKVQATRKAKLVLQARTQLLDEQPEYRRGQSALAEIDNLIHEYTVNIEKLKSLRGTISAAAEQAVAVRVRHLEKAEGGPTSVLAKLEDRLKAA